MRHELASGTGWPVPAGQPEDEASAEVRSIRRQTEKKFRLFVCGCLLACLLLLLAMRAAGATSALADRTLRLNFHGARLAQVLDYLSDAAGFIIQKETDVPGTIEMWSKEPVTREEAVQLLNAALKKSGCAVLRNGRVLTIVSASQAKTADLEIVTGNDPDQAEKSDETVTQLISVRYANAGQMLNNLQGLLPASATLTVNESANTLILVATKAEIRRMLKIISALDSAVATTSSVRVFPLRYADAKDTATLLPQVFASTGTQTGAGQTSRGETFNLPGPGDFGPPGMPGPPGGSGNSGGPAAAPKVIAVADERSNGLVVSAPSDFLPLITNILHQLDQPAADATELRVFRLVNADATELAAQLAEVFPDSSTGDDSQNQLPMVFGGPPPPGPMGMDGAAGSQTSSTGTRALKQSRVLAVADARTSSLLVSAGRALMPQVAALVAQLDSVSARHEVVNVWDLHNADPQDVNQVLQALFNRNNTSANNNNSQNPLLGQNNPLTARQTQQQSSSSTTANFGSAGAGQGGGMTGARSGGF